MDEIVPNDQTRVGKDSSGHEHDVQIVWNMMPFVLITWPIAIPLNIMLWPFTIISIPFVLIWNVIITTAMATPPLIIYRALVGYDQWWLIWGNY